MHSMKSGVYDWVVAALTDIEKVGVAVLVTQCSVEGSTPREVGVKMLVCQNSFIGTIGGGSLEYQIIKQARALLVRSDFSYLVQDYPLGPLLAQCCGGHVRILLERLTRDDVDWLLSIKELVEHNQSVGFVIETRLDDQYPRKNIVSDKRLLADTGISAGEVQFIGKNGALPRMRPVISDCTRMLEYISLNGPVLYLFGAGHVGKSLAHVLSITDIKVEWFDPRDEYVSDVGNFPIKKLEDLENVVTKARKGAMFIVLTHSHSLDYDLVKAVLLKGDFRYCGLIGSKTKKARFERRLRDDGLSDAQISKLTSPIGDPKTSGKTPAGIAFSVASEILEICETEIAEISSVRANGVSATGDYNKKSSAEL